MKTFDIISSQGYRRAGPEDDSDDSEDEDDDFDFDGKLNDILNCKCWLK